MIEEMGGDLLQWLRGFYFVAKGKSFSWAGLQMGRNQPTITHHVKCLEREFGIQLFDRSGNKVSLTSEGEFFFQKAITIFEQLNEMKDYASRAKLSIKGRIRIASIQAIITHYLPQRISEFLKKHPGVNFDLEAGGLDEILKKIEFADADFGILSESSVPKHLLYHDLFETQAVLIAPKNFPLVPKEPSTLRQLAEMRFIFGSKTTTLARFIDKEFTEAGLSPKKVVVTSSFESVKNLVALGIGVSILDDYMVTQEDKKKVDVFSLRRFFRPRPHGIILRKRKYLSPPAKAFLKSIKPDILID